MNRQLILFVDHDYLIPVVDGHDGDLVKYASLEDCRLWLYFYDSPHKSGLDFGRNCKGNYESESPGYFGSFWENVANDVKFASRLAELPYCELLEHSGILKILRDFYIESSGADGLKIPTVFVFSDTISPEVRKVFLRYMEQRNFSTVSYSVSINDLAVTSLLSTHHSLKPQFGEKIIFLQSSGKDLLMSYTTFDGTHFLAGEKPQIVENSGDSPVKRALVELVVNKVDERNSFLTTITRVKECSYQMQFVDKWLELKSNDVSFVIDDFHYSSDPSITYSCKIDCAYLRSVQEDAIMDVLRAIDTYKNKKIKNDLLQVILFGDAFSDGLFQQKVTSTLGDSRKVLYLSSYDMQEVLHTYMRRHKELKEPLSQFDSIIQLQQQSANSITTWIVSAENIRQLLFDSKELAEAYQRALSILAKKSNEQQSKYKKEMESSRFEGAKATLKLLDEAIADIEQLNKRADKLVAQSEANAQLYLLTNQFAGAKMVTDEIQQLLQSIDQMEQAFRDFLHTRNQQLEAIEFYQANYEKYKELLQKIRKEGSYTLRKKLVEEMSLLTMEPLPEIDVDDFKITLQAEIVKYGSFFSKKKKLMVTIEIESGKELPCNCLLLVAPELLVRIREDKAFIEAFSKGLKGKMEREYELPLTNCERAKELYLYFWPGKDELISINAFTVNKCNIKV